VELTERIKAILDILIRETSPHGSSVDTHFENACREIYECISSQLDDEITHYILFIKLNQRFSEDYRRVQNEG
jgi:hypothetical protein